jgi:hypothetical protein
VADWATGAIAASDSPASLGLINSTPGWSLTSDDDKQAAPANEDTAKPAVDYDVAGARKAGVSDTAIASYLAEKTGYNLAGALKAGVTPEAVIDHLAPTPAPAAPEPEKSGLFGGIAKAAGAALTSYAGTVVSGIGDIAKSSATALKGAADDYARLQSGFDAVDKGTAPSSAVHNSTEFDRNMISKYASADAATRADMRKNYDPGALQSIYENATGSEAVRGLGGDIVDVGKSVTDYGESALTPEENSRKSVRITKAITSLGAFVGTEVATGMAGIVGVSGLQAYSNTYDEAKAAGSNEADAATAASLSAMEQGGLMVVPVHKAMGVLDAVPAAFKSSVIKGLWEATKSAGTMIGFSQLSKLADNAVAQSTYDPGRSITEGVGHLSDIAEEGLTGFIVPLAGAGLGMAGAAVGRAIKARREAAPAPGEKDLTDEEIEQRIETGAPAAVDAKIADVVTAAPDLDSVIAAAQSAATGAPVATDTNPAPLDSVVAGKDALDEAAGTTQQDKIRDLFVGMNTGDIEQADDGTVNYTPKGATAPSPMRVWNPATAVPDGSMVTPDLAQKITNHYANEHGIDVVWIDDPGKNVPFDGAVDPNHPNTIFLSNNPDRAVTQVAAHEVGHVFENVKTPDTVDANGNTVPGVSLGSVLNEVMLKGMTSDAWKVAFERFSSTAPKREDYGPGQQGDVEHAQDSAAFFVNELAKDTAAEAHKFPAFEGMVMDKVSDLIEQRYGPDAAKGIMAQFLDGIKTAMKTMRDLFVGDSGAKTISDKILTNLSDVHNVVAEMHARKYAERFEPPAAETTNPKGWEINHAATPVDIANRIETPAAGEDFDTRQMMHDTGTQFSPRVKQEETEGTPVPKEVAIASGYKNSEAIASSKRWQTGRDLKVAMQEAVQRLAAKAGVDLTDKSTHTTEHLVKSVTSDVMHALKQNAGAIGWYDLKTRQALRVASLVHPEIATDPNARFAFVFGLAASSNGVKVDKNFDYAEQIYNYYKAKGEMPTHLKFGLAQESINKTLEMFNTLSKKWGLDKFRKFMLTKYVMKEITALSGVKPAGEHADTVGRGAAVMGPKIGNGFFSNLYGHFDALTMDRWLIRTWGRHTGTLIVPEPELADTSRARVGEALRSIDPKDADRLSRLIGHPVQPNMNYVDDLAAAVKDASADPEKRTELANTPEGDELRKASINLIKYLDGQKEAPEGPHERVYIRKVFQATLEEVKKDPRYAGITMADMQAVLWYAEKRLYEHAKTDSDAEETGGVKGYEEEAEAPDYANAAVGMVKNSNKAVLNDPTLSGDEKSARIISDRRINAALAKEANGRPDATQSGLSGPGTGDGSGRVATGGFTGREKRAFAKSAAAQDVRSARLGNDAASFSFERKSSGDGGKSRVLKSLGVTYDAEWKAGTGLRRVYEKNGSKVPVRILELSPGDDKNAARFEKSITEAKNSGKDGAAVAVYPAEDYKNFKLLMSDDGKSGAAVKPDGDIISVFSTNGTGHAIFEAAIAAGGRKLDAFDTILPDFYHSHGFIEAARTAWNDEFAPEGWDKAHFAEFNNGKPDVVLMVLDRGNVSPQLDKAKVFKTWDEAAKAQEKLLAKKDKENPGSIINLRLDRLDGEKPFTLPQAKGEIEKTGAQVVASKTRKIYGKEGEPGVVAHLSRPLSADEASDLSSRLKQEAIPQFANGRGELHGPEAEKWGEFDPNKFHTMDEKPAFSPRLTPEERARIEKLENEILNKKPLETEKPKAEDEPGFTTNPAKIANEHEAQVSSIEAEATKAAAEKAAPKTEEQPKTEPKPRQLNVKHIEGDKEYIGRALNNDLTRRLANAPQVEKANEVIAKDRDRAMRIAMREEQPPDSWKLQPSVVWTELERQAIKADDRETQRILRTSPLAKELTTAGRLIQSMSLRDKLSANDRIDEVLEAREAAAKDAVEKTHGSLEVAQKITAAKAEPEMAKAIKTAIKKRLPPLQELANFINSIKCN